MRLKNLWNTIKTKIFLIPNTNQSSLQHGYETSDTTKPLNEDDLVYRLRKRADIRRSIITRKSVQNNEPDRIADLLDEAADHIEHLEKVKDLHRDAHRKCVELSRKNLKHESN